MWSSDLRKRLENLGDTETVSYLGDLKQLLTEQPSVGIKGEGKSGQPVISDVEPPQEDSVQKLLATSALRKQFKISGQIGELGKEDKISFSSLAHQIQTGLAQGYVESEIVDGVICSITPGIMVLRSYLETHQGLTLDRLKKYLSL